MGGGVREGRKGLTAFTQDDLGLLKQEKEVSEADR